MSDGDQRILVVAEARLGELREISFELVSAAVGLKAGAPAQVQVVVIDPQAEALTPALALAGVDEVLAVPAPTVSYEAHVWERALEQLLAAERPTVVLAGFTVDSMGFAPALAARHNLGFASDVAAIAWDDGLRASRGAYGDKLVAELAFPGRDCTLLMVRPGAGTAAPATPAGDVPVRTLSLDLDDAARTEHVGFRDVPPGDVDITTAEFLVSVGRGVQEREHVPRFEQLADRLGATLSVSRPLVDAGWVTSARQVGQSGKTVKPRLYLALGISGAVQHLAGMRDAETIIAINTDPEAPIFGVAHYGATVDMFEFADKLEQALQA